MTRGEQAIMPAVRDGTGRTHKPRSATGGGSFTASVSFQSPNPKTGLNRDPLQTLVGGSHSTMGCLPAGRQARQATSRRRRGCLPHGARADPPLSRAEPERPSPSWVRVSACEETTLTHTHTLSSSQPTHSTQI